MTKKILILLTLTFLFITVLVSCDSKTQSSESVTNINLDTTKVTMKPGESITVLANVLPSKLSDAVSWYSTDASIATVKDGVVTALNNGTVLVVCASDNGVFAKCTVTVDSGECAHEVEWKTITEATCTNVGRRYGVCKSCGMFIDEEEIPMTAHTPGREEKKNEKAATCSAAGSYELIVYCSVCTKEASRKTVTLQKLEHTYDTSTVTKLATCTADGEETATCKVCKQNEVTKISALGHLIVHIEAKAPTCQSDGWKAYDDCKRTDCDYTTIERITGGEHEYTISFIMGNPTAASSAKGMLTCLVDGCEYNSSELKTYPALTSSEYTVENLAGGQKKYTISVKNAEGETVKASFII